MGDISGRMRPRIFRTRRGLAARVGAVPESQQPRPDGEAVLERLSETVFGATSNAYPTMPRDGCPDCVSNVRATRLPRCTPILVTPEASRSLSSARPVAIGTLRTVHATGWGRPDAAKDRLVAVAGAAPPGDFDLFRADIDEVIVIRLGPSSDHLIIGTWRAGSGLRVSRHY